MNEYLCQNEVKIAYGFFVAQTAFSPQSGLAWLVDFVEPAD